MAGDWIKFELATMDKPEVCQIADLADIDTDAAVGKLLRVWGWFDQQTEDGNAPSVSKRLLDRLVGVSGFCEHMKSVGWMVEADSLISLPHFERHNGKTAKNRLLTAKRVANHKAANAKGNDRIVSSALPREDVEKIKREKQKPPLPPEGELALSEPAAEGLFASFWKVYPRKTDKAKAQKSWDKLRPDQPLFEQIMAGLARHCESRDWLKDDGQFIPHPTTWLNGKRWEDEVKPAGNVHHLPASRHSGFAERDYTKGLKDLGDGTYAF